MESVCIPDGYVNFSWAVEKFGFGQLGFWYNEEQKKIYCDNELMNKEFILKLLTKMIEDSELTCV